MRKQIAGLAKTLFFERPGKRAGLESLQTKLQTTQANIEARLNAAAGSEKDIKTLRHVIAIERWGQRRLKVALGEELLEDENHAYKPESDTPWADLKRQFGQTREQTLALSNELRGKNLDVRVPHNDFGPMTLLGWLAYLNSHANLEAKRIRAQ